MRVVFPTDENMGYLSQRGAHFGKAKYYTIIRLEEGRIADVECIENPGHSGGACGNAVANIMALEPDAMVVSDLYFDRESRTVEKSVAMLLEGKLEKSSGNGTCSTH